MRNRSRCAFGETPSWLEDPSERLGAAEPGTSGTVADAVAGIQCGAGDVDAHPFDIACGSDAQFRLEQPGQLSNIVMWAPTSSACQRPSRRNVPSAQVRGDLAGWPLGVIPAAWVGEEDRCLFQVEPWHVTYRASELARWHVPD